MKLLIPVALGCLLSYLAHQSSCAYPTNYLAAQIQVESDWRPQVSSKYAHGLTQFTPDTWKDWALKDCQDIFNPECSIKAQIRYMTYLRAKYKSMHNAWGAYNGGGGWNKRETKLCNQVKGCNPNNPLHLEKLCRAVGRSVSACTENINYPRKIERLLT